jgi:DNA-binding response OmpR family regulator
MQDENQSNSETAETEDTHPSIITVGPINLDTVRHVVTVDNKSAKLTPTESVCLNFLAVHANTVCTPDHITSQVWGYSNAGDSGLVKSHIRHLRQKIEPDPMHPIYLLTIPEVGYMLVSKDQDETKE